MKRFLYWLVIVGIIVNLGKFIIENYYSFTRIFDPHFFGHIYSQSQYVIGERSAGGIGDDGLYAFAGYYYLFQGGDVTSVNFEHPPLAKYLIGLSIFLFHNQNVINIIYFCILLVLTYKLGQNILGDNLLALVPTALLSLDPLFLDNLKYSLLDLPFTLFFITATYFFLLGLKQKTHFFLSFGFWGAAFSTRFFPSMIIIYSYLFLIIFLYKREYLSTFFVASFLIPIVYLASHAAFFVYHPSITEFFHHKKWMLSWFTGTPIILGNIWRNVFTGFYIDPTGKLAANQYWSPILPGVAILAVSRWRMRLIRKDKIDILITYILCIIYLIYVTLFTYGVQKFLMPIYPLLIILAVSNLSWLYSIMGACRKLILAQLKVK